MKRLVLVLTLVCLVLVFTPAATGQVPPGTTTILFTNFCDGATITVNGDFIAGTHDNYDCNGGQTFLSGVVAKDFFLAPKLLPTSRANLNDNAGLLVTPACPLNLYLDFTNNGWAFYSSCDFASPQKLVNKGKFTVGGNLRQIGGVAAWQGAYQPDDTDQAEPDSAYPKGTYTLTLANYCDFFHVTAKGSKIGGTHDLLTNCGLADAHSAGNNANLPADIQGTAGPGAYLDSDAGPISYGQDYLINYYFDWASSTWANYFTFDSTGMQAGFSGTFTFSPGLVTHAKGLPSSAIRH